MATFAVKPHAFHGDLRLTRIAQTLPMPMPAPRQDLSGPLAALVSWCGSGGAAGGEGGAAPPSTPGARAEAANGLSTPASQQRAM